MAQGTTSAAGAVIDVVVNSSLSDRVAVAAAVLAAAAFAVGFLQLIYAYWTSELRSKCSSGGIGGWHIYSKTNWELHGCIWTARVVYPEIDLRLEKLLEARYKADRERDLSLPHFDSLGPGYGWADRSYFDNANELGFWHVWHETSVFNDPDNKFVTLSQLPLRARLEWIWYLIKHPRRRFLSSRASWANLLACFKVIPGKSKTLVLSQQRADVIPNQLDAPLQTTSLANMGLLCFLLGMKDVTIDVLAGTIFAHNRFARVTTLSLNIPGATKVVTLEGDIDGLRGMTTQPSIGELWEAAAWTNGKFEFVKFVADPYVFQPMWILYAIQNEWSSERWKAHSFVHRISENPQSSGNLMWEATEYSRATETSVTVVDWVSFWVGLGVGASSSLIQTLTFLPYHSMISGFPLESYLDPFSSHILSAIGTWWESEGEKLCVSDPTVYRDLSRGSAPFLRHTSAFLMMAGASIWENGTRSWIFHSTIRLLKEWDQSWLSNLIEVNEDGIFAKQFPMLPTVYRLLDGQTLESVRKDISQREAMSGGQFVTIEAALWFTLITLEARLETLWDIVLDPNPKNPPNNIPDDRPPSPHLCSFIGLWLHLCQDCDPLAGLDVVTRKLTSLLDEWQNSDEPIFAKPALPQGFTEKADLKDNPAMSKRQFYEWMKERPRKVLDGMIPWMQLRSFILFFYLNCNGDSSVASAAESNSLRIHVG